MRSIVGGCVVVGWQSGCRDLWPLWLESVDYRPDLENRGVAFVKIDSALLVEIRKSKGTKKLNKLVDSFKRSRIHLIVEKLEEDDDLMTLLEAGATLGQGYLFGEPRLARPAA